MLHFYYGTDGEAARAQARARLAALRRAHQDAEVFVLRPESFSAGHFGDLVVGTGLFARAALVHTDSLFENEEAKAFFVEHLGDIVASPNIFVCAEGVVDAETVRAIKKEASEVQEYKKAKVAPEFNIFALADALAARDKKQAWTLYVQALATGLAPEQICGTLFWKVKSLLTAPYPTRNWKAEELRTLSARLVALYHDSHRGKHDFDIALERLVLTL